MKNLVINRYRKKRLIRMNEDNATNEINTQQAALLLGLSPCTLRKWRSTGEQPQLRWIKRFRKVFYLKDNVLMFKQEKTQSSNDGDHYQ